MSEFKTLEMQASLSHVLTRWCLSHATRYRQGLNEVLAPFMALVDGAGKASDDCEVTTSAPAQQFPFDFCLGLETPAHVAQWSNSLEVTHIRFLLFTSSTQSETI
jgi:hypothetical protein